MGMTEDERNEVYSIIASRSVQWDHLLWQMPLLSMTAQAFLFTISLGPETTQLGRTFACVLSIVTLWLVGASMVRQRQSAIADAKWLNKREKHWTTKDKQFGKPWRNRRDGVDAAKNLGVIGKLFPAVKPIITWWLYSFAFFILIDLAILVITWVHPSLLNIPGSLP